MKRNLIIAIIAIVMMVPSFKSLAQDQGESDSITCGKNYSLYSLSYKKRMYEYAIEPWRNMFFNCPDVTVSVYSDGVGLYNHFIKKEQDQLRKEALIDTVMMIYDQRIKYFGDHPKYPEGWIYGRKALEIVKHRRNKPEALVEAMDCFQKSYEQRNAKMEPLVALNWLQCANALSKSNKVSNEELLAIYFDVDGVVEYHLNNEKRPEKKKMLAKLSKACVDIMSKSDLNSCDQLVAGLELKYLQAKDDAKALENLLSLMNNLECTDNELYALVSERNYELNPNASAAYYLAKYFIKKQQIDKAVEYYAKALEMEEDDLNKSKYNFELALIMFSHYKNGPKARDYAFASLKHNSSWGKPHILIGNIYAVESKKYGANEFEHKTVYWAALDRFKKAKAVDPECMQEAEKQIALYSQYIPDKETGFFHGLEEGSTYTIGSWINEETVVRYR
ncbi:tetratricopeptide repeat protein [Carboxylicivirga sp. N1Y90]|uniref:tetratricopeptide repeat protein n=1 Tax=Carboxylicivirga fragile TaxID=3417571 RepID=UPI003D352A27|nr:hypothetical protein [Marinilabiliaceae bacterium N1Y90]